MANTIKIKRSATPAQAPATLDYGELALNYADGKIFYKNRITHPIYSARKSLRLFEKIIFSILKKKNNHKYIFIDKFNILSVALEDFFWQYCYQFTKYKNFS